jgi:hypothetical protein
VLVGDLGERVEACATPARKDDALYAVSWVEGNAGM